MTGGKSVSALRTTRHQCLAKDDWRELTIAIVLHSVDKLVFDRRPSASVVLQCPPREEEESCAASLHTRTHLVLLSYLSYLVPDHI